MPEIWLASVYFMRINSLQCEKLSNWFTSFLTRNSCQFRSLSAHFGFTFHLSVLSRKALSDLGDHGDTDLPFIREVSAFSKTSQTAGVSRSGEERMGGILLLKNYTVAQT